MEMVNLNPSLRTVQVGSADPVPLRAKSFKVLEILAENAPDPVDKDTIVDLAWEGRAVSDDSLVQCVSDIRKALGVFGHELLQTLPSLGYRFMGRADRAGSSAKLTVRRGVRVDLFEDISADASGSALAYGLFSDLVHALTKARVFRVINSLHTGPGDDTCECSIGGTVQIQGHHIRIVTMLSDLENGEVLWTQRWDGELGDFFHLQDQIVAAIVNEIGGTWSGRVARLHAKDREQRQTEDIDAYSHMQFGVVAAASFTEEGLGQAMDHFQKATELDPGYGVAWACQSIILAIMTTAAVGDRLKSLIEARYQTARMAGSCAGRNAWSLLVSGWAEAYDGDFGKARDRIEQAVVEEPNNSDILVTAAHFGIFNTDMREEPLVWAERAFELNPNRPEFHYWPMGYTLLLNERYADALDALRKGPQNYPELLAFKAGVEFALGQTEAAAETCGRLLTVFPAFSVSEYLSSEPWGTEEKAAHVRKLMIRAGLPA